MKGEVDGGEGGLESCELRTREGAVGDYAVDKGLVDRAAEKGAIACGVVGSVGIGLWGRGKRTGGPYDVVRGGAVEG